MTSKVCVSTCGGDFNLCATGETQGGQGPSLLLLYLCSLTSYGIKPGIQQALSRCLLSEQRNNAQGNECPTSKKYPLSSDNFYQGDGSDTI